MHCSCTCKCTWVLAGARTATRSPLGLPSDLHPHCATDTKTAASSATIQHGLPPHSLHPAKCSSGASLRQARALWTRGEAREARMQGAQLLRTAFCPALAMHWLCNCELLLVGRELLVAIHQCDVLQFKWRQPDETGGEPITSYMLQFCHLPGPVTETELLVVRRSFPTVACKS